MPIKILVFSIFVDDKSIEKVYYLSERTFISVEKFYLDSLRSFDEKITLYDLHTDSCVIYYNGEFDIQSVQLLKGGGWTRSDVGEYETKKQLFELSDQNGFLIKKNIGPTEELIKCIAFPYNFAYLDLISEIHEINSAFYILNTCEVNYLDKTILKEELIEAREPNESDIQQFKELLYLFKRKY